MATISEIGEQLKQRFLEGQGIVTQTPGRAAPSTRRFYKTHKGFDVGVPVNTKLNTAGLEFVGSYKDRTGYGLRSQYFDPKSNRSFFFSHLSRVTPKGISYTGGIPGVHGRSTGPHVDIEISRGRRSLPITQANYVSMLNNITKGGKGRNKLRISRVLQTARSKYGNRVGAISSKKSYLEQLRQRFGGKVVKL